MATLVSVYKLSRCIRLICPDSLWVRKAPAREGPESNGRPHPRLIWWEHPFEAGRGLCPFLCPLSIKSGSKWSQPSDGEIVAVCTKIQGDSNSSLHIVKVSAATVNRRVVGSSPT